MGLGVRLRPKPAGRGQGTELGTTKTWRYRSFSSDYAAFSKTETIPLQRKHGNCDADGDASRLELGGSFDRTKTAVEFHTYPPTSGRFALGVTCIWPLTGSNLTDDFWILASAKIFWSHYSGNARLFYSPSYRAPQLAGAAQDDGHGSERHCGAHEDKQAAEPAVGGAVPGPECRADLQRRDHAP